MPSGWLRPAQTNALEPAINQAETAAETMCGWYPERLAQAVSEITKPA
jgi:hypothetical protein